MINCSTTDQTLVYDKFLLSYLVLLKGINTGFLQIFFLLISQSFLSSLFKKIFIIYVY